jgi:hypothetical protein
MHFPRGADYLLHLTQSLHSFWGFSRGRLIVKVGMSKEGHASQAACMHALGLEMAQGFDLSVGTSHKENSMCLKL